MSTTGPALAPTTLDAAKLLATPDLHRLVLRATLTPVTGDRFQPAGFPEIGHVLYDAPRPGQTTEKVCILDSAASMANHLEAVCRAGQFDSGLHPDLTGLPHVQCWTDDGQGNGLKSLVVTSLSEGHRLASSYFLEAMVVGADGDATKDPFGPALLAQLGLRDLKKKTHPLVDQWWGVFTTLFRYDPNSLVHGVLFPAWGIKLPRLLTAQHEAFGAARVGSSGVKFDHLGKTTSGQPIFAVDEETAHEIRATFVIDLSLLRSFGRDDSGNEKNSIGLTQDQKIFLLEFALWKIDRLLAAPFRFRSNCDLESKRLEWLGDAGSFERATLNVNIKKALERAYTGNSQVVTKVYYPSSELFKPGRDEDKRAKADGAEGGRSEGGEDEEGQEENE